MNSINQLAFIRLIFLVFCCFYTAVAFSAEGERTMTLILKSPDFTHQEEIPKIFTCDGDDSSPALSWTGLPQNTKSLVLIVDDPDAPDPAKPKMTWVHWLLYNIPPTVAELPKAVAIAALPVGTRLSKYNNFGYILTSLFMDSSRFKNRLELIEKRC
jgi:Raf kinase inhibitor-like YbhB/YbcL family protein